jgi:ankyrin repeat protein
LWIATLLGLLGLGQAAAGTLRPQDEALFRALGGIDPAEITQQFLAGADVNAEDGQHRTPLILAVTYEKLEAVDLLLGRGAKVNHVPPRGVPTALGAAASHGNLEIVRLLLRYGADPNLRGADGYTPLELAANGGKAKAEIVAELLAHGVRIEKPSGGSRSAGVVKTAVASCDTPSLVALLKAGATLEGVTARSLASCSPDLIGTIAEVGFDLNWRDARGQTVLLEAVTGSDPKAVRRLLSLGADPGLAATNGETPLMRAIPSSGADHWEIVKALLDHHADFNVRDAQGRTVLHRAAAAGRRKTISLLIAAGADPNAPDGGGHTPGGLYWRQVVSSAPSPRNIGAGLRRVYFLLPGDFQECAPPPVQPQLLVLGNCFSLMQERTLGVSISWAPRGATVQSTGPRKGLTVSEAEWQGKKLPIGRYTLSDQEVGGIQDPEVWIAIVPLPERPFFVSVWAPQEYGEEAGWTLRGILGSLRQPSPIQQFFALPWGQMATGWSAIVGVLALLGTGLLWLLLKRFPELRPQLRFTTKKGR